LFCRKINVEARQDMKFRVPQQATPLDVRELARNEALPQSQKQRINRFQKWMWVTADNTGRLKSIIPGRAFEDHVNSSHDDQSKQEIIKAGEDSLHN
jgi:hypothetical protein